MGFVDFEKKDVAKYAWAAVIPYLKEFGSIGLQELVGALQEYLKEAKTPDGWTEEEYLGYAIGRLRVVRNRDLLLPWFLEAPLDGAIEDLEDRLEEKLAELGDDEEKE